MKKLALLLLVLPIPAFASDFSDLRMQQAAEARTVCVGKNIAPESPNYASCVNGYLQSRYGWRVVRLSDGSLGAAQVGAGGPPASINNTDSIANNNAGLAGFSTSRPPSR